MCERKWEISEIPSGTWYVQKEGVPSAADEVVVCGGLTKEQTMAIAAASGRVLINARERWQRWEVPK